MRITLKNSLLMNSLSLVLTPLVLFVSSANSLYLGNQEDLGYQIQVLLPFFFIFFVVILFGFLLLSLSSHKIINVVLWNYYMVGIFFLIYFPLRDSFPSIMDLPSIGVIIILLYFIASSVIFCKSNILFIKKLSGFIALVILFYEGSYFLIKWEPEKKNLTAFSNS